jgi:hypothetical protein
VAVEPLRAEMCIGFGVDPLGGHAKVVARPADASFYYDWLMSDGAGAFLAAPPIVGKFLATFKEYPPSQCTTTITVAAWRQLQWPVGVR